MIRFFFNIQKPHKTPFKRREELRQKVNMEGYTVKANARDLLSFESPISIKNNFLLKLLNKMRNTHE